MANIVDSEQTAPIGAVCSGSTLFASILNKSVMLGNYLQQTTSADNVFKCLFSLHLNLRLSVSALPLRLLGTPGATFKLHVYLGLNHRCTLQFELQAPLRMLFSSVGLLKLLFAL